MEKSGLPNNASINLDLGDLTLKNLEVGADMTSKFDFYD